MQWDPNAAWVLAGAAADLTLVPMPVTLNAHLRGADLPRLRAAGRLGRLLAQQAQVHGEDWAMPALGRAHAGLPDDLLNFQYDPVAVTVAIGWPGAVVREMNLSPVWHGELLHFEPSRRDTAPEWWWSLTGWHSPRPGWRQSSRCDRARRPWPPAGGVSQDRYADPGHTATRPVSRETGLAPGRHHSMAGSHPPLVEWRPMEQRRLAGGRRSRRGARRPAARRPLARRRPVPPCTHPPG